MRKIIFVLLAFLAVFTYIRVFESAEASPAEKKASADNNTEISVEIVR